MYKFPFSFSGTDVSIKASVAGYFVDLGQIQSISISTFREKAPVRVLGSSSPRDYTRGSRTIGGTMIGVRFTDGFLNVLREAGVALIESRQDIAYLLLDQIPPFDLFLSVDVEYPIKEENAPPNYISIYGVEFLTSGVTVSIYDLYTEETLQFVARALIDEPNKGYVVGKPEVSQAGGLSRRQLYDLLRREGVLL